MTDIDRRNVMLGAVAAAVPLPALAAADRVVCLNGATMCCWPDGRYIGYRLWDGEVGKMGPFNRMTDDPTFYHRTIAHMRKVAAGKVKSLDAVCWPASDGGNHTRSSR
jgi:hypothetical protein